jgi:hypothetical protein
MINFNYISNLKNVKTIFLSLLLVFISHYIYNTLHIITENESEVIVNIGDFDSEEENNESEDETKELDEYLFNENCPGFSSFFCSTKSDLVSKRILTPHREVDSPPPLI